MPNYFACGDGLLITLKESRYFFIYNSGKLQSYLAYGKPLVGSLDELGKRLLKILIQGIVLIPKTQLD